MKITKSLGIICLLVLTACFNETDRDISWNAAGKGGAVAAEDKKAVAAGLTMLKKDGNAADAAAATLLALSITDFGAFALGAEISLILYDSERKEVKVMSGLGGAPLDPKAIDWYYQNGIPGEGGIKCVPVPGALSLCMTLLNQYGTMSFEEIIEPTLELLDTGKQDWHPKLAVTLRKLIETERETIGTREEKIQSARDRFYKGDIADDLEAFYIREGSFLRKKDLAAHITRIEDPVQVNYRGYKVYKCGTWTQGPYLCQTLRLLEGFNLKEMGNLSANYIHVLTEAMKLGFADRDEHYGDPLYADVPLEQLLSDEYTELRRSLIDMDKASEEAIPGDPVNMKAVKSPAYSKPGIGGTTTCLVTDRWGNMIAATPSGNTPYSICPKTGVAHGNRLRSLNTTPGHPNRIEPGKRPRITLTPTLVLKDEIPILAISVAGADLQDQTTLSLLLNFIEFGIEPKVAVLNPRFNTVLHQNSFDPNPDRSETIKQPVVLNVEDKVDSEVIEELKKRGHKINTFSGASSDPVMLFVDPKTGIAYVAGDPRVGRHAAVVNYLKDHSK
jgi:gamma-glutamyltranspeptidase/glutathione hydrolase